MALAIAAALSLASHVWAGDLGPLAPAAEGKVQCFGPNTAAKTCASMEAYRFGAHGKIERIATTPIANGPEVIVRTTEPVQLKADGTCATLRPEYVERWTFTIGGRPATGAETARQRAQLKASLRRVVGHEGCTRYAPSGDGFLAVSSIDGHRLPETRQKLIWVSPSEGYRVAFPVTPFGP